MCEGRGCLFVSSKINKLEFVTLMIEEIVAHMARISRVPDKLLILTFLISSTAL